VKVLEMLHLAAEVRAACLPSTWPCRIAQAVIDILSESAPCAYQRPAVRAATRGVDGWLVDVPASWVGGATPDGARAMARMLLCAADAAEEAL